MRPILLILSLLPVLAFAATVPLASAAPGGGSRFPPPAAASSQKGSGQASGSGEGALRLFESRVRPVLAEKCYACHGPKLQQGGLRMDSRGALLAGGGRGAAVAPGDAEKSLLLKAVRQADPSLKMPPDSRLGDRDIAAIEAWIRAGASWGPDAAKPKPEPDRKGRNAKSAAAAERNSAGAAHWAFQPVRLPNVPAVKDATWAKSPVDAFVLAALEAKGLAPAPPADRRTLIRRACFDLTGLPPAPEEVEAFVADRAPDAFARVVDRLLASPRYGERWGRHWLDCVRYADSNGLDENYHYANAWRYRDYVIDAFNRDEPYDQFLREQLAGDLLPPSPSAAENYRRLIATGYFLLGPKLLANPDKAQVQADILDEQLDVTSRALMGVTLACARCHDHKFDPFTQKDYYALAGIFQSTRTMESLKDRLWMERPLAPEAEVERYKAHLAAIASLELRIKDAPKQTPPPTAADIAQMQAQLRELKQTTPPAPPYALAVAEGEGQDARLLVRGDHNNPADTVPRGFPAILAGKRQPGLDKSRSGRLELADWLTRPDHPLTARVIVNRVWQWHFGRALVTTTDNFGKLGEPPSHPELLDYLAFRFSTPEGQGGKGAGGQGGKGDGGGLGWSLKRLHRELMLSAAYQMSSSEPKSESGRKREADPDNRLLGRMNRTRLDAEQQRDAMLAIAGELDPAMGGSLLTSVPNHERVTNDGSSDLAAEVYLQSRRRTVYLPVIRNSLFEMLETFDFADASAVSPTRSETLASPQALFLLNHPFMARVAERFAARLLRESPDDRRRLDRAWRLVYSRPPEPKEADAALAWLADYQAAAGGGEGGRLKAWSALCQTLFCSNEFLYVD